MKTHFSRIIVALLFLFFCVSPCAVFAKETITSDEFIQNFDPDTKYKTGSEAILPPAKQRMPIDGDHKVGTLTQDQQALKNITEACKISGCNVTEEYELYKKTGISLNPEFQKPKKTWIASTEIFKA